MDVQWVVYGVDVNVFEDKNGWFYVNVEFDEMKCLLVMGYKDIVDFFSFVVIQNDCLFFFLYMINVLGFN